MFEALIRPILLVSSSGKPFGELALLPWAHSLVLREICVYFVKVVFVLSLDLIEDLHFVPFDLAFVVETVMNGFWLGGAGQNV